MKLHLCICVFLLISVSLQSLDSKQIIDLTWDFNNDTIYWPGGTPLTYTLKISKYSSKGFWYAMNEFCTAEHGGTHFDAPYHFNEAGWKVGDIPIERLVAKGALIDLKNENLLLPKHLEKWENDNGKFENNTAILLKFHWSHLWQNKTAYLGLDNEGKKNFPGVSPEAADWIVQNNKIVGVGLDTSSVDPGSSSDFIAHRVLSKKQIYFMENVKILETLPPKGFTLFVMPMKLQEGTGAPLRLFAITEESH